MMALLRKGDRLSKAGMRFAAISFFESVNCTSLRYSKLFCSEFSNEVDRCVRFAHHGYRLASDPIESRQSSFIRNLLYPNTNDEVINQLKTCETVEEVVRIIENNETLNQQQLSQVILILRDLQKLNDLQMLFDYPPARLNECFHHKLNELPFFQKLLHLMEMNIDTMEIDELSCCLLYLNKLNVNLKYPVVGKLIDVCEKKLLPSNTDDLSLADLARFFITVKDYNNIWSLYTMNMYIPLLTDRLDACENYDDFRHITICFQKSVPLLSDYHLNKYTKKIDMLLHESSDCDEYLRMRTILKSIVFLNFKHWNGSYVNEVKSLISAMKGKLSHLSFEEISLLHKIVFSMQEPVYLLREIEEVTKTWITTHAEEHKSLFPFRVFQVTSSGMQFLSDEGIRMKLKEYTKKTTCIDERTSPFASLNFLLLNTDLKYDKEITNIFWSAMADSIKSPDDDETLENIFWIMHKYVFFISAKNTNRCDSLEKYIIPEIVRLLHNEQKFNYNPSHYTKLALTVLAFHRNPFQFFTEAVWQKILDYIPRLSIQDNLFVSIVLRLAAERLKKRQRNIATFLRYYVHLISATNASTLNMLHHDVNITPEKLNTMLFTHSLTEGLKNSKIFTEICERLKSVTIQELYSKIIRDSIFNFTICDHVVPEFINLIVEYCIRENAVISGNTAAVVLNYCYMFGFSPERIDEFLSIAAMLIERDRELLGSALYLRIASALSYFGELPVSWSDNIFNIEYLKRLDEQCKKLNFKNAYFLKRELMELNRILCIDYPSRDIPWFHEKYCHEQKTFERSVPSAFHVSVLNTLKSLVNVEGSIDTNCVSPYGHKIDILLYLDENGNPTNYNLCDPTKIQRVAFILKTSSLSTYFNGKGKLELFLRQLEMLNYRVILLHKQQWNSMYMSDHSVKKDYLRKLIWTV